MENQKSISLTSIEIITLTSSLLLIIGYFLPWVSILTMNISGYELPNNLSQLAELLDEPRNSSILMWIKFIHLIPVTTIILAINVYSKKPLLNLLSIIPIVVLGMINIQILSHGFDISGLEAGYILSAIGFMGMIILLIHSMRDYGNNLYQVINFILMIVLFLCIVLAIYTKLVL